MEVLMKPLVKDQPPRTTFLVQDLKYEPRTVYMILCSVITPIKGHDNEEDVVGITKNILFNIIHGIPINLHDFFLRTLADNAMSPIDYMHSSDLLPCLHYKRPSYIFLPEAADNGNPTSGCSNSPPNSPSQSTCITPHHAALQPSCLKHVLGHINRQT